MERESVGVGESVRVSSSDGECENEEVNDWDRERASWLNDTERVEERESDGSSESVMLIVVELEGDTSFPRDREGVLVFVQVGSQERLTLSDVEWD